MWQLSTMLLPPALLGSLPLVRVMLGKRHSIGTLNSLA
jgi:hypothetical protein